MGVGPADIADIAEGNAEDDAHGSGASHIASYALRISIFLLCIMVNPPPNSFSFSNEFIIGSLAASAAISYGIAYTVLALVPDLKAPPPPPGKWSGRKLDLAWFMWFILHIAIYPASVVPKSLSDVVDWYNAFSRDPVLSGVASRSRDWAWMAIFLHMEFIIQLPCFILGAWGLWRNDKRVYPLLLLYGTTTATTVVPTLYYVMTETAVPAYTAINKYTFLGTYVPFLLIPLAIVFDMMVRIVRLIGIAEGRGIVVTEIKKRK